MTNKEALVYLKAGRRVRCGGGTFTCAWLATLELISVYNTYDPNSDSAWMEDEKDFLAYDYNDFELVEESP